MDKLLRFRPEPFASEMEFENLAYEMQGEGEMEAEYRGRGGQFRARPVRFTRPRMAPRPGGRQNRAGPGFSGRSNYANQGWPQRHRHYRGRRHGSPGWIGAFDSSYADQPEGPPSEFVRGLQTSLNSALGLRLPVDGIMSAPVRSAIRSFQERNGLAVTGYADPQTQAALKPRGAGDAPPDQPDATPAPPPPASEFEAELDLYHPLRQRPAPRKRGQATTLPQKAVAIAKGEYARWNNGRLRETDAKAVPILQDYWKNGPGISYSAANLASRAFQAKHPWSAAFISWVMRKAGAGKDFRYSAAHANYILAAKNNRLAGNANPFKAYRISEVSPGIGDLVCKSRAGSGATYDTIKSGMTTHCDIVVEVKPGALSVIGGNVNQSVFKRNVAIDAAGKITAPDYFAVIQVAKAGVSPVPAPTLPGPAPGPAPAPAPLPHVATPPVLKTETTPPGTTLYAGIDLGIIDRFGIAATPMTGIFVPQGYASGRTTDIVLWLHGFKADANRKLTIDQYWNAARFAYGAFREGVNTSGRNVVLVAPTLGSRSEAGRLLKPGGLDTYLAQVLAVLGQGVPSGLGNLILACHSGGGKPMRALAGGSDRALANLRECWGFDCTYNGGDDTFWAGWARARPGSRCYFYYIKGSPTAPLAESMRAKKVSNAIVLPAGDGRHNYVPITHWRERLEGAPFLGGRRGSSGPPPAPSGEPDDLKSLTHAQFIEFVGQRARKAMAATGVPASVTVAQAILETGWGKHTIGPAKNLFGIKGKGPAGSISVPTREFVNGRWVTVQANFARYDSFEQSITEHARFFLRNKRYARALSVKNDAEAFAREIHKAGYATGPDYADQLISLMRKNNLKRFDTAP